MVFAEDGPVLQSALSEETMDTRRWVMRPKPKQNARARLFCFHYAGGGASSFFPWVPLLGHDIDLITIQFPGRENRLEEPYMTSFQACVDIISRVVSQYDNLPYSFYGHSMGSWFAHYTAKKLISLGERGPSTLFLASLNPPSIFPKNLSIADSPDDQVIRALDIYGGLPRVVLESPELLELQLSIIRADFKLLESFVEPIRSKLNIPMLVFGGLHDSSTNVEKLSEWRHETSASFHIRMLKANHIFINEQKEALVRAVRKNMLCLTD